MQLLKLDLELNLKNDGTAKLVLPTRLKRPANIDSVYTEKIWKNLRKIYRIKYDIDITANFCWIADRKDFMAVTLLPNSCYLEKRERLVDRYENERRYMTHEEIHQAKQAIRAYSEKFKLILPELAIELARLVYTLDGCPNSQ